MRLSKSKYTRFCQCPKMLWLDVYKPELAEVDASVERRLSEGNEVGDLAMRLFGDFTEVTAYKPDGGLDIDAMIKKTAELVEGGADNICEAAFSADGCYCAVDILKKSGGGYAIYEVKSSTGVKDVYIWDVAYQKRVLEKCGINVTGTYIVHINSDYVRHGELDLKKLFEICDVSGGVAEHYPLVDGNIQKAKDYVNSIEEPARRLGEYCNSPYGCAYFGYCGRDIPTPSVFDLYRIGFKKAVNCYNNGIVTYKDAVDSGVKLSEKQLTQIEHATLNKPTYVDKGGVQAFLNTLSYPLYFLDFETFQTCVPMYDGTKPYQQIPFQYSLHYIEKADGKLMHKEFLADENEDPRRAIAESLVENIPANACVLAYNKAFECGRIAELAYSFPDLSHALMTVRGNIKDLLDVFRDGYVYDKAMGGSFSIKSVLPALFPDDPALNYHNLDGVHNGAEATDAFLALRGMERSERDKLRASLLAYCKLDTMAMVMLWQRLREYCV